MTIVVLGVIDVPGIEGVDLRGWTGAIVISFRRLRQAIVAVVLGGDAVRIDVLVLVRIIAGLVPLLARILLEPAVPALVVLGSRIPSRRRLPRATARLQLEIAEMTGVSPAGFRLVGPRLVPYVIRMLTGSG